MKILLSAFYADPEGVSEYYVGFRFWQLLSARHEVHLITDAFKRDRWERFLPPGDPRRERVHFVDLSLFRRFVPSLFNLPYYLFNLKAFLLARRLLRQHSFDLVHHVTASMFRFPVFLSLLGLPFVWGPIGGAVPEPPGFADLFGGDRLDRRFRLLDPLIARFAPLVRLTMARASRILVATPHFFELFPPSVRSKMRQFTLCGFDGGAGPAPEPPCGEGKGPLRILFVGRIVPYKGLQFLVEAMRRLRGRVDARLVVLGSGPFEAECRRKVGEAGLSDVVEFRGKVAHEGVLSAMAECHVYAIPSLRESWGISPLEAMSLGRPVVGVANGGLDVVLDDECAIRIRPQGPEQIVVELTAAFERLAADPALRRRLGEAGRRRVQEVFSWDRVARELEIVYAGVVPA